MLLDIQRRQNAFEHGENLVVVISLILLYLIIKIEFSMNKNSFQRKTGKAKRNQEKHSIENLKKYVPIPYIESSCC